MYKIILFFLSYFAIAPSLVAQSATPADEVIANEDDEDDPELAYSSAEVRERAAAYMAAGFGTAEAWQMFYLSGGLYKTPSTVTFCNLGGGTWKFEESYKARDYQMKINARSLGCGARYYFWDAVPMFVQLAAGYALWQADSKPTGVVEDNNDRHDGKLRFAGNAHGPWISHQVGFQFLWNNGFMLEFSLAGVEKSWVASQSVTNQNSDSRAILRKRIETPQSWALLNLKIGKIFF